MDGLRASRAALFEYVERTGEERFSRIVMPHLIFGRFTGLAWLRFIARRGARHLGELRRILAPHDRRGSGGRA